MPYTTLISVAQLAPILTDPDWVIIDCRFELGDPEAGRRAYEAGHIPKAIYAHLDEDLSGKPLTDRGRHPLPSPAGLTATFSRLGINQHKQVVIYDNRGGAIAARLWWMLRYMGHEAVAVLDGGWQAWQRTGYPTPSGIRTPLPTQFTGRPRPERLVVIDEVLALPRLVDSRAGARYRGEHEPIDAQAGHIPGAVNYFFKQNLADDGYFVPAGQLRQQLEPILADTPSNEVTFYCGSGVTACHNLLAQVHAGLPEGRLYVGSWSEWSASGRDTYPLIREGKQS